MVPSLHSPRLFPNGRAPVAAATAGFRLGQKGTHGCRTIMLSELTSLFDATNAAANRDDYASAIVDSNCLAKPTTSSRRQSNQRLGELYALDIGVPAFRVLRRLWGVEKVGWPLLAILCAIARDPLLAATVPAILSLRIGDELSREQMTATVRDAVGERLNDNTVAKVARNAASSWTQSGHLSGRTFKKRQQVAPTASSVTYALFLGHAAGFRGADLFNSAWMAILDCSPAQGRQLAVEAKRMGLIDLRMAGEVIELNLDRLDPANARN